MTTTILSVMGAIAVGMYCATMHEQKNYHRALSAVAIGAASTVHHQVPAKVERSKCDVCRGTGRIRTGDGLSTVPCPNCVLDRVEKMGSRFKTKMLLVFTSSHCAPCKPIVDGLKKSHLQVRDWTGNGTSQVWIIDATKHPGLARKYGVLKVPTAIFVGDEQSPVEFDGAPSVDSFVKFYEEDGSC